MIKTCEFCGGGIVAGRRACREQLAYRRRERICIHCGENAPMPGASWCASCKDFIGYMDCPGVGCVPGRNARECAVCGRRRAAPNDDVCAECDASGQYLGCSEVVSC